MELYGENTRLIAVLPSDGVCGEIVTEWDVQGKNCCAGVAELSVDPDTAPEVMADNLTSYITWLGGRGPYTVSTGSEGLYIEEIGRRSAQTAANVIVIRSTSICGMVAINIKDSCGQSATHRMRATNGKWVLIDPPQGPDCLPGVPEFVPVHYVDNRYGVTFESIKMEFHYGEHLFCENITEIDPEQLCLEQVGPGTQDYNCGYWPVLRGVYPGAGCTRPEELDKRFIVCSGIIPGSRSWYRWEC